MYSEDFQDQLRAAPHAQRGGSVFMHYRICELDHEIIALQTLHERYLLATGLTDTRVAEFEIRIAQQKFRALVDDTKRALAIAGEPRNPDEAVLFLQLTVQLAEAEQAISGEELQVEIARLTRQRQHAETAQLTRQRPQTGAAMMFEMPAEAVVTRQPSEADVYEQWVAQRLADEAAARKKCTCLCC